MNPSRLRLPQSHMNNHTYWQIYFPVRSCWQDPAQHFKFSGANLELEHCAPCKAQHRLAVAMHVPFIKRMPKKFFSPQQVAWLQQWASELHPFCPMVKQSLQALPRQNLLLPQWKSLQHSRHLLKGQTPQQCPDAQSESGTHDFPFGLGAMHLRFLLSTICKEKSSYQFIQEEC